MLIQIAINIAVILIAILLLDFLSKKQISYLLHLILTKNEVTHQAEIARLLTAFEVFGDILKSSNIEERVRAQAIKEHSNVQLQLLRDTLEKDKKYKEEQKKSLEKQEPIIAKIIDSDGLPKEVDINEYDVLG